GTPFSVPSPELGVYPGPVMDFSSYGHALRSHPFQNYNPFGHTEQPQQPTYAPPTIVHQDTGYETMDQDDSPMGEEGRIESMDSKLQQESPVMSYQPRQYE